MHVAATPTADASIRILALCATYNRKNATLASLRSLAEQVLPADVSLTFAVVDDASSDGTLVAVQKDFPQALTIDCGGERYWAGAMRFGFQQFWNPHLYTHLLVFNDDCLFHPQAISMAFNALQAGVPNEKGAVAVGALRTPELDAPTYGGLVKRKWLPGVYFKRVTPNGGPQDVDTLNMNFALIDAKCLQHNALIGPKFTHGFADFDFGLRARSQGTRLILTEGYVGFCSRNDARHTWEDTSLPFRQRHRLIFQPKGLPLLPRMTYLKAHAPLAWPFIFAWPYFRFYVSQFMLTMKNAGTRHDSEKRHPR